MRIYTSPPGVVSHQPLTDLDQASMRAAIVASFRGLFGRDPTGLPGSGADDVAYWIAVSDHYGEFSDHIWRAGWSAYWEMKLAGSDSANPALGDQPARFQPGILIPRPTPIPAPPAPPTPAPAPVDLGPILARLAALEQTVAALSSHLAVVADEADEALHRPLPRYVAKLFGITIVSRPEGS